MQSIKQANMSFLQKEYPNLYEQYIGYEPRDKDIHIEYAKNNDPIVSKRTASSNKYMYSKYNPNAEAEKWLEQTKSDSEPAKHMLLFGLGLGYHLDAIVKEYPDSKIYILEPDPDVFFAYIEARNMKESLRHRNIAALAIGFDERVVYNFTSILANHVSEELTIKVVPYYQREHNELYSNLMSGVKRALKHHKTELATGLLFETEWPRNCIKNMSAFLQTPDISGLKDCYRNVPALVVGSGPSLADELELLKTLKGKYVIIAAGTSIQALLLNNIKPDLVVSIDGGEPNYRAFKDVDLTEIPLLFTPIVHNGIVSKPMKNAIRFSTSSDTLTPYVLPNDIENTVFLSAATVTASAMQAANLLGCNPIMLVGQDLSYPNDTFYTAGIDHISKESLQKTIEEQGLEMVSNVTGGYNRTSSKMKVTLTAIEHLVMLLSKNTFINTSRRGAQIKGADFKALEQCIEEYPADPSRRINLSENIADIAYDQAQVINRGKEKLSELYLELKQLNIRTQNLLKLIDNDELKLMTTKKAQQQINKINEKWSKINDMPVFSKALSMSTEAHIKIMVKQLPHMIEEQDVKKRLRLLQKNLRGLISALDKLTPQLMNWTEEAIGKI